MTTLGAAERGLCLFAGSAQWGLKNCVLARLYKGGLCDSKKTNSTGFSNRLCGMASVFEGFLTWLMASSGSTARSTQAFLF